MKRRFLVLIGVLLLVGALAGTALAGGRVWSTGGGFDDKLIGSGYLGPSEDDEGRYIYIDLSHVDGASEDSY